MKLTGKCKEDFEKWFYVNDGIKQSMAQFSDLTLYAFLQLPFAMQYGVYVDFFDSVEIEITVMPTQLKWFNIRVGKTWIDNKCESRTEARIKALEKANEIYNNN